MCDQNIFSDIHMVSVAPISSIGRVEGKTQVLQFCTACISQIDINSICWQIELIGEEGPLLARHEIGLESEVTSRSTFHATTGNAQQAIPGIDGGVCVADPAGQQIIACRLKIDIAVDVVCPSISVVAGCHRCAILKCYRTGCLAVILFIHGLVELYIAFVLIAIKGYVAAVYFIGAAQNTILVLISGLDTCFVCNFDVMVLGIILYGVGEVIAHGVNNITANFVGDHDCVIIAPCRGGSMSYNTCVIRIIRYCAEIHPGQIRGNGGAVYGS